MTDSNIVNIPPATVIVPVYNAEISLEECIKSILDLNYPKDRLEIIFIENNSNDASPSILKKYKDRIKILNEEKQGAAAARNKGIKEASHEVLAFTDADCEVDRDWLKKMVGVLAENKNISAVGGKILSKRPCNDIEKYGELIHDNEKSITLFRPPYMASGNAAIKKSIIIELGMFDEELIKAEDGDLSYRLYESGHIFGYAPEAVVFHQNEKTLKGLFKEGFAHGFWAVKAWKKHRNILLESRISFFLRSYIEILKALFMLLFTVAFPRKYTNHFLYKLTFNLGKKSGLLFGSIKFKFIVM